MAGYFLIEEPNGERHLVLDLEGHEGAKVIEEGVTPPRVAGCTRVNGSWKIDKEVARRHAMISQANPTTLIDHILRLEARLEALDKKPGG